MQKFLTEFQAQQHFLLLLKKMTRACPKFIHTYKVNVLRQNSFLFLSGGNLLCVSALECSGGTSHDIHYYHPINLLATPQGISVKGWRTVLTECLSVMKKCLNYQPSGHCSIWKALLGK